MGDPRKFTNKFDSPKKPWDRKRLDEERELIKTYGMTNKRELWRMETILRNHRQNARKLLALPLEERLKREKELMAALNRKGLLKENASLDDVLGLNTAELLERRLQTMVWRKNLALTPKQARQFIVHGHIAVNGRKVNVPSYIVLTGEENRISYSKKPMILAEKKKKQKKEEKKDQKEELREKFEEMKGKEETAKETTEEKAREEQKEEAAKTGKKEEAAEKIKGAEKEEKPVEGAKAVKGKKTQKSEEKGKEPEKTEETKKEPEGKPKEEAAEEEREEGEAS